MNVNKHHFKAKNAFLTSKDNFPRKITKEKVAPREILRRIRYKKSKTNVRISKNAKNKKNRQKMAFFDKKSHF